MNIRRKALLTIAGTLLVLIAALYLVLARLLAAGFSRIEERDARLDMERVREAVAGQIGGICQKANDWAYWDDAYAYAADRNPGFLKTNVAPSAFSGLDVDFILFFDTDGQPISLSGYDPVSAAMAPVAPALLASHFGSSSALTRHADIKSRHSGVLLTDGLAPAFFCSMPILTTDGQGPIRGAVVFGGYLDARRKENLARLTRIDLALIGENEPGFTPEVRASAARLATDGAIAVEILDEGLLVGDMRFNDTAGQRALIARARLPRAIHAQERATMRLVMIALLVLGGVCAIAMIALIEGVVLRRLATLGRAVDALTESCDFKRRIGAAGGDEIARVGQSIDGLLAAVQQVMFVGAEAEERYNVLRDLSPLAFGGFDPIDAVGDRPDLRCAEVSEAWTSLVGRPREALIGRCISEMDGFDLPPNWRDVLRQVLAAHQPAAIELTLARAQRRVRLTVICCRAERVWIWIEPLTAND
ncbi:MAG: hypothetical protein MUF51_03360 [Vicinamibacteria bacterium]|jgi:sensor domain CHASE-containing protein|nr:hypothetical protein [Vicinamibacteria bacterium]